MTLPDAGQRARGPEAVQGARGRSGPEAVQGAKEWEELRVKEEPMFGSKGGDRGFWVP